ncbi:MAG: cation:proton antiporter [Deltaproteobacteria bacterium]|nr:cation:proton antiporter [Deltaproteobacteria bacterium]
MGLLDPQFLIELLVLLAVATAGVAIFERLRLPAIAGFLVMGALVGPGGLGLISQPERVRALAELGVVFLLFEIGLELPLERLRKLWRLALFGGGLQVIATVACVAGIATAMGLDLPAALVMGGLVAMSSTALVMRILSERGEIDAPQGQLTVGILLFQDLCVVPFLLGVSILAARSTGNAADVAFGLARSLAELAVFFLVARFAFPYLLDRAARVRSREIFTMVALLAVVGSAVFAEQIGLTLAVGAFAGGLVLSASPYAHQLFAEVVPLRGLLLGIFFTAVGMLFDPAVALENLAGVAAYFVCVVVLKAGFIAAIVAIALRQGVRLGVLTGLALAQTGEFSFVLAAAASDADLLDSGLRQVFVAGSIATLVATPFLVGVAPRVAQFLDRRAERAPRRADEDAVETFRNHVILVGFGLAGQNLARVLKARGIPYVALDSNAGAVADSRSRGEPVLYGDAMRHSILERVGIADARLIAVAISDPIGTREVVALARSLAPEIPIYARTRYVLEVDELEKLGATMVVAEEFESTLALTGSTLRHFGVSEDSIARFTTELRDEGYEFMRAPETILDPWLTDLLDEVATHWVDVPASFEGSRSLSELGVRAQTGANVVAVERTGSMTPSPDPSFEVQRGDRLLALGSPEAIERLRELVS